MMTMLNRSVPNASPQLALTDSELFLLDHIMLDIGKARPAAKTLSFYLTKIARLGSYLARASDPQPGNTVMWRDLSRFTDIELGAEIGAIFVGIERHAGRILFGAGLSRFKTPQIRL